MNALASDISRHIWETKYRDANHEGGECTLADTWRRMARAIAAVEPSDVSVWEERFFDLLQDFKFLPGGRIHAGAGTSHHVTLFNCFVMGPIEDSIPGIFRALQESALTMQQGGGIGLDFSALRPRGTRARGAATIASGPVSFMDVWDAMCGTMLSTGARRGAMMATLRCDHPDIEEFVTAKRQAGRLRRFNLSVQVTDDFMAAVRSDAEWPLLFPAAAVQGDGGEMLRQWPGAGQPLPCRIVRRIRARALWDLILRETYDHAEPGVLFIDRINQANNLWYRERISATNPCGEIPLPPYGACDLGSINLTRFIHSPFTPKATVDAKGLADMVLLAVRFLDNVIDASGYPLPQQAENARGSRRIGLGITGLADAMLMMDLRYGSDRSLDFAAHVMRLICHAAYRTSAALAEEKSSFPYFERDKHLQGAFIRSLPGDIQKRIATQGIRNSHLLAIAPTGTISLLAGNISSGAEPIFADSYTRKVLAEDGTPKTFVLTDYAIDHWLPQRGIPQGVTAAFVTASELPASDHVRVQAALQPFVDNSISKTINVPQDYPFEEFEKIYDLAYDLKLKGCTTFRPNPVTGTVLDHGSGERAPHCCNIEREAD